nr:hypothetical protein HK105_005586 [Polyrhizophydium stewartii]
MAATAASTPWRFAGCHDVADMLERLPAELDAAIIKHTNLATRYLLGRIPLPISRETAILMWAECVMADDVALVPALPAVSHGYFGILAYSREMVAALKKRGLAEQTIQECIDEFWRDSSYPVKFLIDQCPQVAPLLLPFVQRRYPGWRDDDRLRELVVVVIAASGDIDLFNEQYDRLKQGRRLESYRSTRTDCALIATRIGHWSLARRLVGDYDARDCIGNAAVRNDIKMLELILRRAGPIKIDCINVNKALRHESNEFALALISRRGKNYLHLDAAMCVSYGNLDVLRKIATPAVLMSDSVIKEMPCAAARGRLDLLKDWVDVSLWLVSLPDDGSESDEAPKAEAALQGPVTMLDVALQARGKPIEAHVVDTLARIGKLALVNQLHAHGFRFTASAMDGAARSGHLGVVKFLHAHGFGCTTDAMDGAIEGRHLNIARFLHANRTEGCTDKALRSAISFKKASFVRFLLENRPECKLDVALDHAAKRCHPEVVSYLHEGIARGSCKCKCLQTAVFGQNVPLTKMLAESGHALGDEAARQAGARGNIKIVQMLVPILDARQRKLVRVAAVTAGQRKLVGRIDWNLQTPTGQ